MIDPYNKSCLESDKKIITLNCQQNSITTNENNHDPNDPHITPHLASVHRR